MAFDAVRLVVDGRIIERQGVVDRGRAFRLALIPELLDLPLVQSVLISTAVGRAQAPATPTVSSPGVLVEVPKVVRMTFEAAEAQLQEFGLKARKREIVTSKKPNQVLRQDPAEGELVPSGSTVTVYLAKPQEEEATDDVSSPPS